MRCPTLFALVAAASPVCAWEMSAAFRPVSQRASTSRQHLSTVHMSEPEHFDYFVIGGGSGGIASARRAAAHGAKVAVVERARLGGTCVNVGCVPKKCMFNAVSVHEIIEQAEGYGYEVGDVSFSFPKLKAKIDAYLVRLNGIYKNNLANSGVTFIEGDATFSGEKEITVGDATYSAETVLIAVGGQPSVPEIPGAELGITSDGFFELTDVPKKVAVIGSGYIAVELAGILNLMGAEVDLIVRGEILKTMEQAVVEKLKEQMTAAGVNFVKGELSGIEAGEESKVVSLKDGTSREGYNEVLFAIGREPVTDSLNLDKTGVKMNGKGHIVVDDASVAADGVYAVGDVIGKIDLTPVAIAAGRLLADRLYAGAPLEDTKMDYDMIPTVVFSHPPLAVMGLTQAEAVDKYGEEQVTIHKTTFVNMMYSREFLVEEQDQPRSFAQLVCVGPDQKVVGLHMIGLNVDEMLQGFSVAIKMGATKADFDSVVALHPTASEELCTIPPWQAKYQMRPPVLPEPSDLA